MNQDAAKERGRLAQVGRSSKRAERAGAAQKLLRSLAVKYYGSSISELAVALGVSRDTARAWLAEAPRRPRRAVIARIELLAVLCAEAARYMARGRQVGRWTLAPHPAFGGRSPAEVVAEDGAAGLGALLERMIDYVPARSDPELELDEAKLLAGIRATLGAEVAQAIEEIAAGPELDVDEEDLADLDALDGDEPLSEPRSSESDRQVAPNPERGGWDVRKAGAGRVSAHARTKAEAERRAREMIAREGGGELVTHDKNGRPVARKKVAHARSKGAVAKALSAKSGKAGKRKPSGRAGKART